MTNYRMFYHPDREEYDYPGNLGLGYEQVFFSSADGTLLSGWFIPATGVASPKAAKGTVIHLHGNAQNMTSHWRFASFVPRRGYNLFTFDYRGYGDSDPARPEPKGVLEDSIAALDYLRSRTDIDPKRLFVFGQSLGGMLAIAAAASSPAGIRAVLAEAPIHSYTLHMQERMPDSGLHFDDSCTASAFVAKLAPIPLLLIHGTGDTIVRCTHSQRLLAEAGEPKRLVTIDGGRHIDAMNERVHGTAYQDLMIEFFEESGGRP